MEYLRTVTGRYAPREEVRKIQGEFYHYDDLAKVSNSYHRKNNGKVIFDLDSRKWVYMGEVEGKSRATMYYINGEPVPCASRNFTSRVSVDDGDVMVNRTTAYIEGYIYKNSMSLSKNKRQRSMQRDPHKNKYPYSFDPESDIHGSIINRKKEFANNFHPEVKEFFDNFLQKFSLGVEIETSNGVIDDHQLVDYQMFPLRDGSIPNIEYCTAPITNSTDLYRLRAFFEEKFSYDRSCSIHVHVGGLPKKDKRIIVAFYYLCYRIQNELHNCVPSYRKNLDHLRNTQKDYGKLFKGFGMEYIKNIDPEQMFPVIYKFLTGGKEFSGRWEKHPMDGSNKWNYYMRYYFVNMINYLFKPSGTVEFRLFPSSSHFDIVFVWISLCLAIVEFAYNHAEKILANKEKINITEILEASTFPDKIKAVISEYLLAFQEVSYEEMILGTETFDNYMMSYNNIHKTLHKKLLSCLEETGPTVTSGRPSAHGDLDLILG